MLFCTCPIFAELLCLWLLYDLYIILDVWSDLCNYRICFWKSFKSLCRYTNISNALTKIYGLSDVRLRSWLFIILIKFYIEWTFSFFFYNFKIEWIMMYFQTFHSFKCMNAILLRMKWNAFLPVNNAIWLASRCDRSLSNKVMYIKCITLLYSEWHSFASVFLGFYLQILIKWGQQQLFKLF